MNQVIKTCDGKLYSVDLQMDFIERSVDDPSAMKSYVKTWYEKTTVYKDPTYISRKISMLHIDATVHFTNFVFSVVPPYNYDYNYNYTRL